MKIANIHSLPMVIAAPLTLALNPTICESAPVPPVTFVVKDSHDAMRGVKWTTPKFPKMTAKAGTVRGLVKDTAGKPLIGARIEVRCSAIGGTESYVRGKTDARGAYEVFLPTGTCKVSSANHIVRYNGSTYLLPLRPLDGDCDDFPAARGHIEHFVLQTFGVIDQIQASSNPTFGHNYYGAPLTLTWDANPSEGGTLEISLTPRGRLLDGSSGRILVAHVPNTGDGSPIFFNDIPLGRYTLQVNQVKSGQSKPLNLQIYGEQKEPNESLQIDFPPSFTSGASMYSSGASKVTVTIHP